MIKTTAIWLLNLMAFVALFFLMVYATIIVAVFIQTGNMIS